MNILAHTCFIGTTGYANHARSFFVALNKYHTVKVRNLTIGNGWKGFNQHPHDDEPYITEEMKEMLYQQTLYNNDNTRTDLPIYNYNKDFIPDVHIVLTEMNQEYFYDEYEGYKIAFNVWETTRYPEQFFNRLLTFNEVWVPSQWQYDSLVEQGYPKEKISVVPEGVDVKTFTPLKKFPVKDKFRFLLFGRWDYRKSTGEILKTFVKTFEGMENDVEMICSIENPYPYDGMNSTQERLDHLGIKSDLLKLVNFPSREEYVKYLQEGDVFVSCARSEGWNLPLCIPEGKLIFNNEKLTPIENVKENDIVVSHTGKEQKVVKTFKRKYVGDIVNIRLFNDHESLVLTPEHPVYVIKRNRFITKKGKFQNIPHINPEWIKSKEIKKGDIILRTTVSQKHSENEIIDLLSFDNNLKYDNEKVWYNTGYNSNGELKTYNRFVKLHDLSYVFGWYIAEGCDGDNKVIFTLNNPKEIEIADKLISEINKIFGTDGNYTTVGIGNTLRLVFNSVLLCKVLTCFCGKMSYNKKIPEKILLGPLDVLNDLIKNMTLGDGHLSKTNHTSYTTVSQILGRQLIFANQRLGIKSTIQIGKRHNRIEKRVCYVICWETNNSNHRHSNKSWWHTEGLAILVREVNNVPYNGFVYNLEVENDNSYLMSNATVHNCESMACGTPSIYSNWGGQLQFANDKGIPVEIVGLKPANIERKDFPGEYCEPDFEDLGKQMMMVYQNYDKVKTSALKESKVIRKNFDWDTVAKTACQILKKYDKSFVFVTTGDIGYMPIIEKMVKSLLEFSKSKIIVYGVNCEVPFDSPNMIKKTLTPPVHSIHDKWYWKQYACIESLNEDYENFVWIDGDIVVNYNIDNIKKYFSEIEDYPIPDIHVQDEFFGTYEEGKTQLFNEELAKEMKIKKSNPYAHVCLYVYNKNCLFWFQDIIKLYKSVPLSDYNRLYMWNDEGIDNALRWLNESKKFLPLSNFDTSGYDEKTGDALNDFYKFWNETGPQNFNKIYGYQFIPKDKSNIIYFHGNKNPEISDKMIEFIKMKRDDSFYNSEYFYSDVYKVENYGDIKEVIGSTIEIAEKYGWGRAIYHEIYNLREYYYNRERKIFPGDIVVDLGANTGVFNRWAFSQGASKVISFEPDKRYYKLLWLNTPKTWINNEPQSILFNAAMSHKIGEMELHESNHLGGSSLIEFSDYIRKYKVRTYTLDYLFDTGLIDRIDFLKIDTEGAEIQIMEGISDENLKKVKNISLEYHHRALGLDVELRSKFIERLNKNGFNSFIQFLGYDESLQLIYFWR